VTARPPHVRDRLTTLTFIFLKYRSRIAPTSSGK